MNNETSDSFKSIVMNWIREKFGNKGVYVFLTFCFLLIVFWFLRKNWDDLPGVTYLQRRAIPQADSERFSILVPHLENDKNNEFERIIIEDLKEVNGIQVLSIDRTIQLEGSVPEELEKQGHEQAQEYLAESGGSVMLWGGVISQGNQRIPKLYWTSSTKEKKSNRYFSPTSETHLRMPELFWTDLSNILRLNIIAKQVELISDQGAYVADRLEPFIAKVRYLLENTESQRGWDEESKASVYCVLGTALCVYGDQSGEKSHFREALEVYRNALQIRTQKQYPLDWAGTQNNIGNVLVKLGECESDSHLFEEAVKAYKLALQERTREKVPFDWAKTQNNLGAVYLRIGERESGSGSLKMGAECFRLTLLEYTRDRVPMDWALAQNNLGSALTLIGERESDIDILHDAINVLSLALQERTRDKVPLDWADTQNNLGNAFCVLGRNEDKKEYLFKAVKAYRSALQERTRGRVPLDWASTQVNLGSALVEIGKRGQDSRRIEDAVRAYKLAIQEYPREQMPKTWADIQHHYCPVKSQINSVGYR